MSQRKRASALDPQTRDRAYLFDDRADAGAALAEHLLGYRGKDALVLGIPRGGVSVAREVAVRLDAELDVMVARKIGAPTQKELAIGAVTADGTRVLNHALIKTLRVEPAYLEHETKLEQQVALDRERRFRGGLPAPQLRDRTVILVDDGLATGATVQACIAALKRLAQRPIVVAVPLGSQAACAEIAEEVDELVCPYQPEPFFSVGAHYRSFGQVSDEEVVRLLREHRDLRAPPSELR